jgi:hypothetical protein
MSQLSKNTAIEIDDEGFKSYAGAKEYNRLLEEFTFLNNNQILLQNDPNNTVRDKHLSELKDIFF